MRLLYTAIFYVFLPLAFLRLWVRGKKLPAYRKRWKERLGFSAGITTNKKVLWFHTVSVGEFIAARPLIEHYINQADTKVLVTTMTPTGSERVQASFTNRVLHCYLPYDLPDAVCRFLNRYKPDTFICLETELWPNLIHYCNKKNIPVLIANARLSEKSAKGYQKVAWLTRPMLDKITLAAIQNETDAQRFISLGLAKKSARIIGNIKFDLTLSDDLRKDVLTLKNALSKNNTFKLIIAASTHKGEDEIILRAFYRIKRQQPNTRLILVPRHPERFDQVFTLCRENNFTTVRRSEQSIRHLDIYLGDTMGDLLLLLGASDIAFIGGSLVNNGGHNYIEAAAWALPILTGPSTFNFREVAHALVENEALTICRDAHDIETTTLNLLENADEARSMGIRAQRVADQNRGAQAQLIQQINSLRVQ